jgi:cytochrome c biogenesis protein CcdA
MGALSRSRRKAKSEAETGHASLATPLALGVFTGFLPCTPLIAAQTAAAATGSPITAATAMIGFGLGTAPLMLVFGLGSSMLTKAFERKLQIVAAIAVMLFGLVVLNRGLMLVGSPVTFETLRATVVGSAPSTGTTGGFTTGADGVVEVRIAIADTEYHPDRVVIPAGRVVRLVVDRQEDVACSDQLSIPVAHVLVDLKANGVTRVDVPAMKAGTYTLTCGMGMMSGKIVAVRTGPIHPAGDIASVIVLVLLGLVAVGALAACLWRMRARSRARR